MAINPVQLVGLQRQTPDFVGEFLRGKQFKQQSDNQNRIMDMREEEFAAAQAEKEAARQAAMRQAENNYWGKASDMLASAPEEQRPAIWNVVRQQGIASGLPGVAEEMPETYQPGIEVAMNRKARLGGYEPPQKEGGGVGKLDPGLYTPESLAKFDRSQNYADLERRAENDSAFAKIDAAQYTPESVARFEQTGSRGDLVFRDQGPKASGPGQTAVDKAFAPKYAQWTASGGFADTKKQIDQLKEARESLMSGANLTGPGVGRTPDWLRTIVNPKSIETREAVEEVVQRNLREVLGAQFTEKEGDRLIKRAYNDNLSEAENAKRVGRLIDQIETAAQQQAGAMKYFEENGTLTGWEGKLPSMSDFTSMEFDEDSDVSLDDLVNQYAN